MKPVAILGSGPAGLLAAHAVALSGKPLVILSKPEKSKISGAQFLHESIPGLTSETPDAMITYKVEGDEATYRQKIYGHAPVPFTSFSGVHDGMVQPAWSLINIYDQLWEAFGDLITPMALSAEQLESVKGDFDFIVSAVPRPALCMGLAGLMPENHGFYSQMIHTVDECKRPGLSDNTILYNGTHDAFWYRTSKLFGHEGTEYPDPAPPFATQSISKPIRCVCTCWPDLVRVGRFGQWRKGVLAHDGFTATLKALQERGYFS